MCRSYGDQFETLLKYKRDLASYLKTQLELRNEQVFDLNDRLLRLQQAIDTQKSILEKALHDLKEKSRLTIEQLENENLLLSNRDQNRQESIFVRFFPHLETRLVACEEFQSQRQQLEATIDELKDLMLKKEDAYRKALDQMRIAVILFKDRSTKIDMDSFQCDLSL